MNTRAQPDAGRTGHGPPAWLVSAGGRGAPLTAKQDRDRAALANLSSGGVAEGALADAGGRGNLGVEHRGHAIRSFIICLGRPSPSRKWHRC